MFNPRSRMVAVIVMLAGMVLAMPPLHAQSWVEIRSPHFSVVTDAGDKRGREVALRFEQMRFIYGTLFQRVKVNTSTPLQIFAFKSGKRLKQVAPIWNGKPVEVAGFFQGGKDKQFIVIDLSSYDPWPVVFHEYAHLLLNANYPTTQAWFDEGFAEYFSTIRVSKKEVEIGMPTASAPQYLSHDNLMPAETLFSVVQESDDYYKSGERRSLFYAESWMVVHFLFDTKKLEETGRYFDLVINRKVPVPESIPQAFGVSLKQFNQQLRDYREKGRAMSNVYPLTFSMEPDTFQAKSLAEHEADSMIANMQLRSHDHMQEGVAAMERILQAHPGEAQAHSGLGYAYMQMNKMDEAGEHLRRATELGTNDPQIYYLYALYLQTTAGNVMSTADVRTASLAATGKAIELDPNFAEAYALRGYALSSVGNTDDAIAALQTAIRLSPRNRYFQLNLAGIYLTAGKYENAIGLYQRMKDDPDPQIAKLATDQLEVAERWKKAPIMRMERASNQPLTAPQWQPKDGESMPEELEELEAKQRGEDLKPDVRPVKFLKGTLISVDCSQAPTAVISITAPTGKYILTARNADHLLIIGDGAFSCRWKNRKVAVNYKAGSAHDGDLISLELQ